MPCFDPVLSTEQHAARELICTAAANGVATSGWHFKLRVPPCVLCVQLMRHAEVTFELRDDTTAPSSKPEMPKVRDVVAGVLSRHFPPNPAWGQKAETRYLIAQRGEQAKDFYGYWEFAGGKVDEGETHVEALHREIFEEFGILVDVGERIVTTAPLKTPGGWVRVHAYRIFTEEVALSGPCHRETNWVPLSELTPDFKGFATPSFASIVRALVATEKA